MDVHALIHAFLQQKTIDSLVSVPPELHDEQYTKAGVVPFVIEDGQFRFYFMKPVSKRPDRGEPNLQICKGTRMHQSANKGWVDMKEDKQNNGEQETLVVTAIREAIEELGLKLECIGRMMDVGPYRFSSEKTGNSKRMWLFALEMANTHDVLPASQIEPSTAERGWLSLEEFAMVGRADHRYILRDIATKLAGHYKA